MRKKDAEEVKINKLWMADGGETQMNTINQGTQAEGQSHHKPSVIHTAYTCI